MRALVPLVTLLPLLLACDKPVLPTLVPERVRITRVSAAEIDFVVTVAATNPNSITLVARSLTAHVKVADQYDLGTVEQPVTTALPAKRTTQLEVPMSVQVKDIAGLAALGATHAKIPYSVDGEVGLGGDLVHVELPYKLSDTVPRDEIIQAALASIPGLR
jgi:LEA14-like dessication related protein